jgi:NitT/TauT family transport system permease protein
MSEPARLEMRNTDPAHSASPPATAPAARPASIAKLRAALPRRQQLTLALVTCTGVVALWEVAVRTGWLNETYCPSPSTIAVTLWRMTTEEHFLTDVAISNARVWGAFLLSAVMAIPLGILMSSYRSLGAALEPIVDFIRYLPVPALVPLSIIWFGVGEETKLFLLWLGTFFQLILLVIDDMNRVPQEYIEVAATVGAQPPQILRDVALRAMLPSLLNNLRITLGWCWTYLILAEIVAADDGIGFVIWSARRFMRTPEVMAGVVAIGLIGLVTDQLLRLLHRRAFRYL